MKGIKCLLAIAMITTVGCGGASSCIAVAMRSPRDVERRGRLPSVVAPPAARADARLPPAAGGERRRSRLA